MFILYFFRYNLAQSVSYCIRANSFVKSDKVIQRHNIEIVFANPIRSRTIVLSNRLIGLDNLILVTKKISRDNFLFELDLLFTLTMTGEVTHVTKSVASKTQS